MTIISESNRFRSTLRETILLPVGLILLASIALTVMVSHLFKVVRWSDHSATVMYQVRTCEKLTLDMETSLRGFLVTGDNRFLLPYTTASRDIQAGFDELAANVRDNPGQSQQLERISSTINQWMVLARQELDIQSALPARQRSPSPGLATRMRERAGIMDDIHNQFADFLKVEEELRSRRFEDVLEVRRQFALGGSALALFLAAMIGRHVRKKMTLLEKGHQAAITAAESRNTELRNQKEWFHVTLSSIGDAVLATDGHGNITFMNPEAARLTGWILSEAMNRPLTEVFRILNAHSRQPAENPVGKVLRENRMVALADHTVLLSRDGMEHPIEDSAAPIYGSSGDIIGVVLVFHDATQVRVAQNALITYSEQLEREVSSRTQTLQDTIIEMESFSYAVSHDLRSPLRAMQGYAQAVLEDYKDKLGEDGCNYLNRIKKAAERLDKLIQDLLAYTRVSREQVKSVTLDIDKLTRDMIDQYPNLHPPEASVIIEGKLLPVQGGESTVTQVLSNLLGNSVKFVAPGVQPIIHIRSEDRGDIVRLWVEDNGIGIAPENQERVFRIFEQVNNQKLYSGTGVGLAIVKRAVESLGGSVGLESTLGKGSRFWVDLKKGENL